MKNIIAFLIIIAVCEVALAGPNTVILDKIENSIYGYTFSNENDETRLNRIEESVYGKSTSGQVSIRVAKLKKDLAADLMGQEIEPKEDTFKQEEDSWVMEKEPVESAKIDYPVINELEKQVFKQEYKNENIKSRLSKLETKTFGKTYENEDLSTRVDRLKAEIQPKTFLANEMEKQENDFYNGDVGRMAQDYHLNSYGEDYAFDYDEYNNRNAFNYPAYSDYDDYPSSPSIFKPSKKLNISTIEKTLYKTKYENEPMHVRLSRIESSVFGTNFSNDTDSERIARISSAINAQKSAKRYDSNKFGQNMATAFQIGTLILMVLACIL